MRRAVVDPHRHRRAVEGDIALHVHFHARRVLQGVAGVAGLNAGVLAHVVEVLLAFHGVHGFLTHNLHYVEQHGALAQCGGAHVDFAQPCGAAVAGVGHSIEEGGVAHGRVSEDGGDSVVLQCVNALLVRHRTTDEGAVVRPQHGNVGIHHRLAVFAFQYSGDQLLGADASAQ